MARGRKAIPVDDAHIEKLEQAILIGATYELAAMYAGMSEKTFKHWRDAAATAPEGTALATLRERLRAAEGRAAIGWLAKIERVANDGDWKACAWKLERRYPETYGRTFQKVALTDASGEREGTLVLKVVYEDALEVTPAPVQLEGPHGESLG